VPLQHRRVIAKKKPSDALSKGFGLSQNFSLRRHYPLQVHQVLSQALANHPVF
jgi:hypothetical protein